MSIAKADAYQHTLCIDLTPTYFRYAVVTTKHKKSVESKEIVLDSFDRSHLEKIIQDDLFSYAFENVVVSYCGARSTLIPVDFFAHSTPLAIFKLNYAAPIDNLDYTRIPELGIVNIYEIPLWVKSLFVIKFPRCKIVHRVTALLKGIFDQPTFSPKLHLNIEPDHFYFLITKKSKLAYYNRFDYREIADLVYYILFVLEQKEYEQADFELYLYGVSSDWKHLEEFKSFFKCKVNIAETPEESTAFIRVKQLLCV